ncbi:MAG TPA: hypothetical protein VFS00_24035, partial [Polyangiaceae bacterium]|nr:hypothetical protein [Polyangiaceae bacterium]
VYCHCFFELADKSALAFFQFADPADQAEFGPALPPSPFRHVALAVDAETFAQIERRVEAAGIKPPDTYVLEHGYCRSLYVTDPDGMIVELTCDAPAAAAEAAVAEKRRTARAELERWLRGDHRSNNTYR